MNCKIYLLITLIVFAGGLGFAQKLAPASAKQNLRKIIPAYADKVEKVVATLQKETPTESVSNLFYVNEYFSTGPVFDVVPLENNDLVSIYEIMSNRRFSKVFSELAKMDKKAASQLVKTNLVSALTAYSRLYDQEIRLRSPVFIIKTNTDTAFNVTVAFQMGTRPGEEGEVTLLGERGKVFSLVWISAMLKLTDNKELVDQVVRLALKQRADLLPGDPTLEPSFKKSMLRGASLYNRQILSSGLIGVTFKEAGTESDVMKKVGIQWQQRTLAAYDAALTEFDRPVQSAAMAPDYSTGSLMVNYVSPMNDTNFDLLLQEIHFK